MMSHTVNALIFSHYHFRDSIKKQEYGKALRYFEIFLNAHDRLEASAKAHIQQQVTQHNEDKKMIEQNTESITGRGIQDIIVNYGMTAPCYEGWQTCDGVSLMLNRVTGNVYNVIEG